MMPINPKEIRYIKLGSGGRWAALSFERGEIHFGYHEVPHELCQSGDWEAVIRVLEDHGRNAPKAKDGTREIRVFAVLHFRLQKLEERRQFTMRFDDGLPEYASNRIDAHRQMLAA